DVGLLLAEVLYESWLGVDDSANRSAELLDAGNLLGDVVLAISGVLGEGLVGLGGRPVLVEATEDIGSEVLGESAGESAATTGSLDVADNADNTDRGSLNDGDSFDDLLLVGTGSGTVDLTEN